MKTKVILVIGGAGFIGSYVNKLLNREGYQTVVLDNLNSGTQETIRSGLFIRGDLGNAALLDNIFSSYSIDAVMHFAALIDVGESIQKPASYYKNNVVNSLLLLEKMLEFHVNKIVFSSSAAVYGIPLKVPLVETDACFPINPYGETKLIVEKMLYDFDRAYGLKSISLRYFNAAGGDPDGEIKNYKKKEHNLIPILLKSIKNGGELTINGTDYPTFDGTCVRDYVHVHDLATAHIQSLKKLFDGGGSDCYNLGNGKGFSIREVIAAAEKVTQRKARIIEGPRRKGDPAELFANPQKAVRDLKWKTCYSDLETIIQHAWHALN